MQRSDASPLLPLQHTKTLVHDMNRQVHHMLLYHSYPIRIIHLDVLHGYPDVSLTYTVLAGYFAQNASISICPGRPTGQRKSLLKSVGLPCPSFI